MKDTFRYQLRRMHKLLNCSQLKGIGKNNGLKQIEDSYQGSPDVSQFADCLCQFPQSQLQGTFTGSLLNVTGQFSIKSPFAYLLHFHYGLSGRNDTAAEQTVLIVEIRCIAVFTLSSFLGCLIGLPAFSVQRRLVHIQFTA